MSDQGPKSAVELAMERLRKKDAEAGVSAVPMTDAQKAAMADVRSVYQAKLAYAELMHSSALAKLAAHGPQADPAARDAMDADYRREREHLHAERDAKIEKIRKGD